MKDPYAILNTRMKIVSGFFNTNKVLKQDKIAIRVTSEELETISLTSEKEGIQIGVPVQAVESVISEARNKRKKGKRAKA